MLDQFNGSATSDEFSSLLDEFEMLLESEQLQNLATRNSGKGEAGGDGWDLEEELTPTSATALNGDHLSRKRTGSEGTIGSGSGSSFLMATSSDIRLRSKTMLNFSITSLMERGASGLGRRWEKMVRLVARVLFTIFEHQGHLTRLVKYAVAKDHEEQLERRVRELELEGAGNIVLETEMVRRITKEAANGEASSLRSPRLTSLRRSSKDSLLSRPFGEMSPLERTEFEVQFQEILSEPKEDPAVNPIVKEILESIRRAMTHETERRRVILHREFTSRGFVLRKPSPKKAPNFTGSSQFIRSSLRSLSSDYAEDYQNTEKLNKRRAALRRWARQPTLAKEIIHLYALMVMGNTFQTTFGPLVEECASTTLPFEVEEVKMLPFEDRQENARNLASLTRIFIDVAQAQSLKHSFETGVRGITFPIRNLLVIALE